MTRPRTIVVGAGIFGLTATLELAERGHEVIVVDPGPVPHPHASSTDISKAFRMEYGADAFYVELAEKSREGWLAWNETLPEPLYHEVGVTMLSRGPFEDSDFESASYECLRRRGHPTEILDAAAIRERFPAWDAARYPSGTFNPHGGYVESGRLVAALARRAEALPAVELRTGRPVLELVEENECVRGVRLPEGALHGDHVVLAAGAWTPEILPELTGLLVSVGQSVFHLEPDDPELFTPPRFTVFGADIAGSGWYGFPWHPREQVVKVAHHGPGLRQAASTEPRDVPSSAEPHLRAFLNDAFPALAAAPIVGRRLCYYSDTADGDFLIARHPGRDGLTLATGGSGHALKFAPVLGELVADALEGRVNSTSARFGWRSSVDGCEAARFRPA